MSDTTEEYLSAYERGYDDGYREGVKTGAEEEVRRRKSGAESHDPTPVESADARLLADCLTRLTDTLEGLKGWKLG